MGGGGANKKKKRSSSSEHSAVIETSLSAVSPKTELIERTPDNDYGVLSDPDEQTTPIMETEPTPVSAHHDLAETVHECNYIQNEQLPSSHSSPQLSPLSQDQHLSTQPPILQTTASNTNKSLETLKLKLMRDKNFSRKITLHTFFSYIILAMEIQHSCSASIAKLDQTSVEELVAYMIDNHSSNEYVKNYLHTLVDTGVVTNIIESIVDFNRENKSSSIETLYTLEENELEMSVIEGRRPEVEETTTTSTTTSTTTTTTTATSDVGISESQHQDTPAPQRCGIFKRMRNFFSGCCCGCK